MPCGRRGVTIRIKAWKMVRKLFFRVTKSARNGINLTSFLLPVSQHHFTFCLLKWRGL